MKQLTMKRCSDPKCENVSGTKKIVGRCANVVSARWLFAWKVDKDGNIVKPKARLVAWGLSQVHTVDFLETHAPTPAASSVKLLVPIAASNMTGNYDS